MERSFAWIVAACIHDISVETNVGSKCTSVLQFVLVRSLILSFILSYAKFSVQNECHQIVRL